jgi:hypothetical protein
MFDGINDTLLNDAIDTQLELFIKELGFLIDIKIKINSITKFEPKLHIEDAIELIKN